MPLNLIACSVPVSVTDYSSYTFVDTRISPAAILCLADHTCTGHCFLHMLYGVRPFQVLQNRADSSLLDYEPTLMHPATDYLDFMCRSLGGLLSVG